MQVTHPGVDERKPMLDARRSGLLSVVGLIVAVGLTGCFGSSAGPANGTASPSGSATEVPGKSPEPTPIQPEAVIVFAGIDPDGATISISGYVAGVIENDGACTYVLTGPGDEQRIDSVGAADAGQTSCGVVQLDTGALLSGSWSVALEYASATVTTTSAPTPLEIP